MCIQARRGDDCATQCKMLIVNYINFLRRALIGMCHREYEADSLRLHLHI